MGYQCCGNHAIVAGSGMAGLLAARVLADHFDRVTVIERDKGPDGPEPRKSVPQSSHIHVLLDRGRTVIERLFPGFFDELLKQGALKADNLLDQAWYHHGVWKVREPSDFVNFMQSRPLLEWHTRHRLAALKNVAFLYEAESTGLVFNAERSAVTGVLVKKSGSESEEQLDCDFVMDATGRASKLVDWIAAAGYERPPVETVTINIGYVTRLYRQTDDPTRDWLSMLIYPNVPRTRLGYIFPIEPDDGGDRWIVTMAGCMSDYPPADEQGWLDFAKSLDRPDIYEVIKDAKPLTPFATCRFPESCRYYYEKLSRLPDGFAAIGDSVCALNPIYGSGITVAALSVESLEEALSGGPSGLGLRFFKKLARCLNDPWMLTNGEDFRYAQVEGHRPPGTSVINWYTGIVHKLSGQDPQVCCEFLNVGNFKKSPFALFHPSIARRVAQYALGMRPLGAETVQFIRLKPGEGMAAKSRAAGRQKKLGETL